MGGGEMVKKCKVEFDQVEIDMFSQTREFNGPLLSDE